MSRLCAVLAVLALPYNNFPFPSLDGSLMPLAAVFLGLFGLAALVEVIRSRPVGQPNEMDRAYAVMLAVFYALSVFGAARLLADPPSIAVSPLRRLAEVTGILAVQVLAYLAGRRVAREWGAARFFDLLIVAFIPVLAIGVLQGISGNAGWANALRSWLTADSFVVQERGRIALLTAEPSWAALDLAAFVLPPALYAVLARRQSRYLLVAVAAILLVYYTHSVLGVVLLGALAASLLATYPRHPVVYLTGLCLFVALLAAGILQPAAPRRVAQSVQDYLGEGRVESIATRMVLHEVALGVFLDHPIAGVGLRNTGYFLREHVRPAYLEFPLVRGYVEDRDRVLDSKALLLEIAAGTGLLGLIAWFVFLAAGVRKLWQLSRIARAEARVLALMALVALVGSFSINLMGYPAFWIVLGVVSGAPAQPPGPGAAA